VIAVVPAKAGIPSLLLLATTAFLFSSCKVEPPKPPLVQSLAVLLFDNDTNDINAPEAMQRLTYLALKRSVYEVADLKFVNQKLKEAGIVDGGQLPVIDPTKLGKDLGVQALVYGSVENFSYTNIGYFLQRKVALELKVVDVATGQTLWEHAGSGATRKMTLNSEEAKANFAKGLADQLIDKTLQTPLEYEARIATINALNTLPGFVFGGFAEDEQSKQERTRATAGEVSKTLFLNK
jgi:hypothetical protein